MLPRVKTFGTNSRGWASVLVLVPRPKPWQLLLELGLRSTLKFVDRLCGTSSKSWRGVGIFFIPDGKILEWYDYTDCVRTRVTVRSGSTDPEPRTGQLLLLDAGLGPGANTAWKHRLEARHLCVYERRL